MTEILIPVTSFNIWVPLPDLIQSCVLFSPEAIDPVDPGSPLPEPGPEVSPWVPVPPGVDYDTLPPAPVIVDTSPTRIIGCVVGVEENPQGRLRALFPLAISGDGVIDRTTNDIWTFDGSQWNNVGPTPGPTILNPIPIPPWIETSIFEAVTRTGLNVEALDYALQLFTEVDQIKSRTRVLAVTAIKRQSPFVNIAIEPLPVEVRKQSKIFGKVVHFEEYWGSYPEPTNLETPWATSMVLVGRNFVAQRWFDIVRGGAQPWVPAFFSADQQLFESEGRVVFGAFGAQVNGTLLNSPNINKYYAYLFKATKPPVLNTAGTIETIVHESDSFSIIEYTSNGIDGATIGHGMGVVPDLMFFRPASTTLSSGGADVVGPVMGGPGFIISTTSSGSRFASASGLQSYDAEVLKLGTNFTYNYFEPTKTICYAFRQKEGQCKIGLYTGNGLPGGQFINCGFQVGVVIIKSRNNQGDWVTLNRWAEPQGRWSSSLNQSSSSVADNVFYSFEGNGFRVDERQPSSFVLNINTLGTDYIYIAFASGFYRKLSCPGVVFGLNAPVPLVASGASLSVRSVELIVKPLPPPYAGVRATVVAAPNTRMVIASPSPSCLAGVAVIVKTILFGIRVSTVPYAGQVTDEATSYVNVVAIRDGQQLEDSVKGCFFRLFKALSNRGLLDRFAGACCLCAARTISGAVVPLKGTYPLVPNENNFNYNRRLGILPVNFSGFISLRVSLADLAPADNHVSAYVSNINTVFSGGDLIGTGFNNNTVSIGRSGTGLGRGFQTRNKNNTTTTSSSPHWVEPSLVGLSRSLADSYVTRIARMDRVVGQNIVDQSVFFNQTDFSLFNFWNGVGDFRVPFYSIGRALDLGALEEEVERFLLDLRENGIPDRKIAAPGSGITLEALAPSLPRLVRISTIAAAIELAATIPLQVGRPRRGIEVTTSNILLLALLPLAATGASVEVPAAGVMVSGLVPSLAQQVSATGGDSVTDITVEGVDYRVHAFTTVGTSSLVVTSGGDVDYLVVAGGGGGGARQGGGGGAGGLLSGALNLAAGSYSITVGGGGNGGTSGGRGSNGSNSTFGSSLTAIGGGGGGGRNTDNAGSSGGSGGGGGGPAAASGSGTAGQGNAGGASNPQLANSGGGGGGAGVNGENAFSTPDQTLNKAGDGGDGLDLTSTFGTGFGDSGWFAGGGGGAHFGNTDNSVGGNGGGGDGVASTDPAGSIAGNPGLANTGGGGGGSLAGTDAGGNGGSGIVLIRYRI
jgi:hypothetical protein